MIVEFRVKNYRSIGEEQVFSMVAGGGDENPQNVSEPTGKMKQGLLRSAVLYGANASGKSNLLRALFTMHRLVLNSVDHKPGDEMTGIAPFLFDEELRMTPTEFDLTFIYNGARYRYGFSTYRTSIQEEWLFAYPKKQLQMLFHRSANDKNNLQYTYKFGVNLKGEKKTIADRTASNVLFFSKASVENHPFLSELAHWFRDSLIVGNWDASSHQMIADTTKRIDKSSEALGWIQRRIRDADFGITEIATETRPYVSTVQFKSFPETLQKQLADSLKDQTVIVVKSVHQIDQNVSLELEEESIGTKRYFGVLGILHPVFETGGIFVVDELDSSLHPLLMQKIVEMFHDPGVNRKGAQLIFSTHDTNLLKPELFRRDQVWFVEKDEREQSQYYSLAEFKTAGGEKVRKDEAWERGYLAGRYGAIPFLGRFEF